MTRERAQSVSCAIQNDNLPKLPRNHAKELFSLRGISPQKPLLKRSFKKMKKTIVRIILVTLLGLAGATPVLADTSPVPVCWPGKPCVAK
jgi:hypothetical protein